MKVRFVAILFVFVISLSCLPAQEAAAAPVAVEPFFPPLCTTVDAQLKSTGDTLSADDEQRVDTARIQRAIDRCGKGRAVRLRVNEDKNAFVSGPLVLKPEVTLILDYGVTLFASRNAALFDMRMGSCGVLNDIPPQCRPLISAEKADNAGVMGDGVIDGRGGQKMLNSKLSWWEMTRQKDGGAARVPPMIDVENSDHFTVYRVTLKDPPSEAIHFDHGDGLTVWGVHLETSKPGASEGDLIVVGAGAKNVSITPKIVPTTTAH